MTWVLWHRPSVKRRGRKWQPVAECATERECTDAMLKHPDRFGAFNTLPAGVNPNHKRTL